MIRASVSSDREGVSATCPRVARGKLAGVGHRFGETEINRSHAAAFRLRCIESPAIRSILAHPFYSIRDIPYDKYLGLIFIRAKGPLPSPLRSAENLRSGDRGSDGFRDLWRLYLVIEFVLARLAVVNAAGMALYPDTTAVSTVFFVESGFSNRTECCDNIIPLPPIFHFNGLIGPANLQFFAHPRIIQIR